MSLNNSAAFPIEQPGPYARGLTKREIFAMAAMQGMIAAEWLVSQPSHREWLAQHAVATADALLAALEPIDAN